MMKKCCGHIRHILFGLVYPALEELRTRCFPKKLSCKEALSSYVSLIKSGSGLIVISKQCKSYITRGSFKVRLCHNL